MTWLGPTGLVEVLSTALREPTKSDCDPEHVMMWAHQSGRNHEHGTTWSIDSDRGLKHDMPLAYLSGRDPKPNAVRTYRSGHGPEDDASWADREWSRHKE